MNIGFTGTRKGMTEKQKKTFTRLMTTLSDSGVEEFHHGNAIGADRQAHLIVLESMVAKTIAYHPAGSVANYGLHQVNATISATYNVTVVRYASRPPLVRNRDIVELTDCLVACPKGFKEELRSGTWATIRYAKKQGRRITIINPDGTIKREN